MTLADWLDSVSVSELHYHLCGLPARKLHLLTAALLRRVWDRLPFHTRIAVEATEKFADGRMTAHELARLRSTDLLESCEGLWLGADGSEQDEQLIGMGCLDCPWCDRVAAEYECRAADKGYALDGVRAAVDQPAWSAVRAALHAREIVAWGAAGEGDVTDGKGEGRAQHEVLREIVGPGAPDPRWPQWRTSDVLALGRAVHRDQVYDGMPILADALQDAGCDDEMVLAHCREGTGHVRGCWVVDLAMGLCSLS
jgi:hypothetical protein